MELPVRLSFFINGLLHVAVVGMARAMLGPVFFLLYTNGFPDDKSFIIIAIIC